MLVVDNFGVKCVRKDHVDHVLWYIKQKYELTKGICCGFKVNWDCNAHTLNISMPGYIKKTFTRT
jgi:hypothetical protein